MQPQQIVTQPKPISKVPLKDRSIFPERSVQHIDPVVQVLISKFSIRACKENC